MSKDILKKALETQLYESFNEMLDQEIPDYQFSSDFEDKMDELLSNQQIKPVKKHRGLIRIVSSLVAASIILGICADVKSEPDLERKKNYGIIPSIEYQVTTAVSETSESFITTATSALSESTKTTQTNALTTILSPIETTTIMSMSSQDIGTEHNSIPKTTALPENPSRFDSENENHPADNNNNTGDDKPPENNDNIDNDHESNNGESFDERGYYMKKLITFASALTIMGSAISSPAYAAENTTPWYWVSEKDKEVIKSMENGDFNFDLDNNGVFDIVDVYLLDRVTDRFCSNHNVDEQVEKNCMENADYNSDGTVDMEDASLLREYFVLNYPIKYEYFSTKSEIWSDQVKIDESYLYYNFIFRLDGCVDRYHAYYKILEDLTDRGDFNPDINGDGKFDILDVCDLYIYQYILTDHNGNRSNLDESHLTPEAMEQIDRLLTIPRYAEVTNKDVHYVLINDLIAYCFSQSPYSAQMLNSEYFNMYRSGYDFETLSWFIYQYASIRELDMDSYFIDYDLINKYCDRSSDEFKFVEDSHPDVNMDGAIDYYDYFDTLIYFYDILDNTSCEDSILPDEVWHNIAENCDYSGNGTSGDIYDLTIVQVYVLINAPDAPQSFESDFQAYVNKLSEKSGKNVDLDSYNGEDITFNYNKKIALLAENPDKSTEDEKNGYLDPSAERSGDANCDGTLNMSDAVLIMQVNSNPDRFGLNGSDPTHITEKGLYNADIYCTGDGVTNADALEIQNILLSE
ncbi:MAG: hypothetical protein NC485_11580 [Ruminococcus flavefaciens]|nr:hypothetical protein [Ruminococcus flavefaciens]MCM1062218.1 hypothetical protein [Eubacterium sp.]